MEIKKTAKDPREQNLVSTILFRYLPYWPLFVVMLLAGLGGAYTFLKMKTPVYLVSANVLVKDESKGADDTRVLEALHVYGPSKIVENEIEVMRSKDLLHKVVDSLHLYAEVFEKGMLRSAPAYNSSPLMVQAKDPEQIVEEVDEAEFSYNKKEQSVLLAGKRYPTNEWVSTAFGILRFVPNPNYAQATSNALFFTLEPVQKTVHRISGELSITAASKLSTVLNLNLRDAVPERGKDVLNALINEYRQETIAEKNRMATNTLAFVDERVRYVVRELDSIEGSLQAFRTQKGVVNISEQGRLYLQSVGENDKRLTELEMQMSMLSEMERFVRAKDNQLGVVPSLNSVRDPLLSSLLQKLFDAQIQYERLKKTVPVGHPSMLSLENEIENLRPRVLENIQNTRESMRAGMYNLTSRTGMYNAMLQSIPKNERNLLDISRQQSIKNDVYSFLLQRREEIALTHAAVVAESRTIEHAYASNAPVSPNRTFAFGVGAALALLLTIGLVYLREVLSSKVLFRADIEQRTGIPVIAEIVRMKRKESQIISTNSPLYLAEQFRQLRAALTLHSRPSRRKHLLITSSISGEGKSFVSSNLATSIALSGRRVVLVDMDLRSPMISKQYNLMEKPGVADLLESERMSFDEAVYPVGSIPNLSIMPAGDGKINPTELFLNGRLGQLFAELKEKFEYVIVDCAPVDPLTDAYVLTEHCETTLFVVRHGYTPKTMLDMLEENNKINALKQPMIVFNSITARGFLRNRYGYGYGYGTRNVYADRTYMGKEMARKA